MEVVESGEVSKPSIILPHSPLTYVQAGPRLDITPKSGHESLIDTALDSTLLPGCEPFQLNPF